MKSVGSLKDELKRFLHRKMLSKSNSQKYLDKNSTALAERKLKMGPSFYAVMIMYFNLYPFLKKIEFANYCQSDSLHQTLSTFKLANSL